jgi:hypothetical protein
MLDVVKLYWVELAIHDLLKSSPVYTHTHVLGHDSMGRLPRHKDLIPWGVIHGCCTGTFWKKDGSYSSARFRPTPSTIRAKVIQFSSPLKQFPYARQEPKPGWHYSVDHSEVVRICRLIWHLKTLSQIGSGLQGGGFLRAIVCGFIDLMLGRWLRHNTTQI